MSEAITPATPAQKVPSLIQNYVSFIGVVVVLNLGDISPFQCVECHPKSEAQTP